MDIALERDRIFDPEADPFEIAYHLQCLTEKTSGRFRIHDFTKASVGKGIMNDFHVKADSSGFWELHVFSQSRISDGDMIITARPDGNLRIRMAFDVEADPKAPTLFKLHAVPYLPHLEIGHYTCKPKVT